MLKSSRDSFVCRALNSKSCVPLLILFMLGACATRTAQHHITAYKDCVHAQAMGMLASTHTAEENARLATAQCQGNLALINEKLREDNAWMEHYGSNADAYSEKLRDRTSAEVAEEIRTARNQPSP